MPLKASLHLPRLRLQARIGAEAPERALPQALAACVLLTFKTPPEACRTGRLQDTVCYAGLTEALKRVCAAREYTLIEELAAELLDAARLSCAPFEVGVRLELTKLHPPLPEAEGGAAFILEETLT